MATLAYLPLYPKDFLGATGRLNAEKFGVYARLLFTSWFEPLNDDLDELSFLAGSSREITKQILDRYFILDNGVWKNHRLEREREKANAKHQKAVESGKKGAELRWGDNSNPNSPPISTPNSRDLSKTIATHNPKPITQNKENSERIKRLFAEFYSAYPRKVSKEPARKAFTRLNPSDELFATMMKALELHKKEWDDINFIPHPSTWINQKRWEDEFNKLEKKSIFDELED